VDRFVVLYVSRVDHITDTMLVVWAV
jgi:hypothetical protein